jgi:hypothetical protein
MNDFKEIELFGNHLRVYPCGKILVRRFNRNEYYEKKCFIRNGYRFLPLYYEKIRKNYRVHRIIAYAFLGFDIENPKIKIDHINRNTTDNFVSNLRQVTQQQNMFNRNAKGYCWDKASQKWRAEIMIDGKSIHLGTFEKEDDARHAYLNAKEKYHVIQ